MVKIPEHIINNVEMRNLTTEDGVPIRNRKAVVNADNNQVLGIVSPRYKIIRNDDLLKAIMPVIEELKMDTKPIAYTTKGGAVTFFKFWGQKNDNGLHTEIRKGDTVRFGVEFFNSYDGSMPLGFHLVALQLICLNGLVVPKSIRELSIRHVKSATPLLIKAELNNFMEKTTDVSKMWQYWTSIRPQIDDLKTFLNKYFGKRQRTNFLTKYQALHESEQTLWGFYSVITSYITHDMKSRKQDLRALRQFKLSENISNRLTGYFESKPHLIESQ